MHVSNIRPAALPEGSTDKEACPVIRHDWQWCNQKLISMGRGEKKSKLKITIVKTVKLCDVLVHFRWMSESSEGSDDNKQLFSLII